MPATATSHGRDAAQREYERRSRQRRAAKVAHMKTTLTKLEVAAVVLQTLWEEDAVWDEFLDATTTRVRHFMRHQVRLTNEAATLSDQQSQMRRLLQEHELAAQAIATMLNERSEDEWSASVERWRAIARKHYQPRSLDACRDDMDAALKAVNAFQWSTDKQTSGVSFLGWKEVRRVDRVRGALQFQFSKTFRGYDVIDYVNAAWDSYTDAALYNKVIMGPNATGDHEVLQQLTPNVMIIRGAERFSNLEVDTHFTYLVFRVKTERGFTQCVRSIYCPELMNEIQGPRDMWPTNFIWLQWELLDGDEKGYKLRIGGAMGEIDLNYATMWMISALACVLRSEQLATGRHLVTSG